MVLADIGVGPGEVPEGPGAALGEVPADIWAVTDPLRLLPDGPCPWADGITAECGPAWAAGPAAAAVPRR